MSELEIATEDHFLQNLGDRLTPMIKASLRPDCKEPIHVLRPKFSYEITAGIDGPIFVATFEVKITKRLPSEFKEREGSATVIVRFYPDSDGKMRIAFDRLKYPTSDSENTLATLYPRFNYKIPFMDSDPSLG